ncbi:MAG: HNH endonuclease, partial [bacterium]
YNIDEYVSQSVNYIYWHTPRYSDEMAINDTVFIWRAGENSGVIAIGHVVELPVPASDVKYPDLLGQNYWIAQNALDSDLKTGVLIEEIRLTESSGMIQRKTVQENEVLGRNPIITLPRGTVFKLNRDETNELLNLWQSNNIVETDGELEGNRKTRLHYLIERSRSLRNLKLNRYRGEFGELKCELCGIEENEIYPASFSNSIFEVHHLTPVSKYKTQKRTMIEDLAILCSNCHRAVHCNNEVEMNYQFLFDFFKSRRAK